MVSMQNEYSGIPLQTIKTFRSNLSNVCTGRSKECYFHRISGVFQCVLVSTLYCLLLDLVLSINSIGPNQACTECNELLLGLVLSN